MSIIFQHEVHFDIPLEEEAQTKDDHEAVQDEDNVSVEAESQPVAETSVVVDQKETIPGEELAVPENTSDKENGKPKMSSLPSLRGRLPRLAGNKKPAGHIPKLNVTKVSKSSSQLQSFSHVTKSS